VGVSNTGPLISALQCGRTDLLKRYFSVIYVVSSEVAELDRHGRGEDLRKLIDDGLITVADPLTQAEKEIAGQIAKRIAADPTSGDPDWRTHRPEAEAMMLMQQRDALLIDVILLDEKAARNVAREMRLRMTGFPGVLAMAGTDGLLTREDMRQSLKNCQQQGTHYSDALIETVSQTYGR